MSTTAAGLIIAQHVATLPTLPEWEAVTVVDGPMLRQDGPNTYLTLGYVAGDDSPALAFLPVPDAQGGLRESGTIGCLLVAGGADVPTARTTALALVGAWAEWLTKDRTMGGELVGDSEAHLEVDLGLGLARSSGGIARARVVITYTAHTYG